MYSLHMNKFGKAIAKGAGYGALGMAAVTADSGNPFTNMAAGAVAGSIAGAISHGKSIRAENLRAKRYDAAKARHAALRKEQFDK